MAAGRRSIRASAGSSRCSRSSHRVIAVELQAHGRTSDRDVPETFTQDADDVAELLAQLNMAKADVLGFSNGGTPALQVAITSSRPREQGDRDLRDLRRAACRRNLAWMEKRDVRRHAADLQRRVPAPHARQRQAAKMSPRQPAHADLQGLERRGHPADSARRCSSSEAIRTSSCRRHAVEMMRLLPKGRLAIFPGRHGEFFGEAMYPPPTAGTRAVRRFGRRVPEVERKRGRREEGKTGRREDGKTETAKGTPNQDRCAPSRHLRSPVVRHPVVRPSISPPFQAG